MTTEQVARSPRLRPVVIRGAGGDVDVQGLVKSTVARGEDEFPSGLLRVSDCHDSVVYALAPLQFASIYCCSDCTVVRTLPGWSTPGNGCFDAASV